VKVYLDDVARIHAELRETCDSVTVQTADYHVDSLEDLGNYPRRRIKELSLSGYDPTVSVTFTEVGAIIHQRHQGEPAAVALASNIRRSVLTCVRPVVRSLTAGPTTIAALAVAAVTPTVAVRAEASWLQFLAIAAFSLAAAMALYGFYVRMDGGSVVYATTRAESPGFLRRNADALAVNGSVALITAVVTFLLTRAFE
jgi:hypothetical protein